MYSRILIATDGSELATKGLQQGLELAKALGSNVTVLTVSEPWVPLGVDATGLAVTEYSLVEEYEKAMELDSKIVLDKAEKLAADAGVKVARLYVARQNPADAIVDTAETQKFDLIVMSSHGRRGLGRVLLGSQANAVLTHSAVPVLVVK